MDLKSKIISYVCGLAPQYGINKILLFGSRARQDSTTRSDYDLAVYADSISSSDWAKFSEQAKGSAPTLCKIDLVLISGKVDKEFLKKIESEGVIIYEKK